MLAVNQPLGLQWLHSRAVVTGKKQESLFLQYVSMAFSAGTIHPAKFVTSRLIAGTWILACVVLYTSYTANLVSSLTVSEVKPPFNSLNEMMHQTEYTYGIMQGSVAQVLLAVRLTGKMLTFVNFVCSNWSQHHSPLMSAKWSSWSR